MVLDGVLGGLFAGAAMIASMTMALGAVSLGASAVGLLLQACGVRRY